jgi:Amt family ammonium transporter
MFMIRRSPTIAFVLVLLPQIVMAAENGAIDTGTTAWMLTSTALVLLMIPGLAMFYGGLVRTKNVLGTMTQVSAASGALTWIVIEGIVFRKATSLGFASGILAGLVAITPAAGVVKPYGAMILGALSSIVCYLAVNAKMKLGYDDSLDCFGIHGVGSGLGVVLLSFFIRESWMQSAAASAGAVGWTVWNQFLIQMMGMGATIGMAVVGTIIIVFIVEKTLGFRIDEQSEIEGLDQSLHGEHGYGLAHPDLMA